MRRLYLLLIVVGILLFLIVSALLARAFSVDGAERSAITELVQSEARGNEQAVLDRVQGCRASDPCRRRVAEDATTLRHFGAVSIIQLQPAAGFSLTGAVGTARVAWTAGGSLPIVQCVRVRRAGDVLAGFRIELLGLSVRIKSDADCPLSF